MRGPVRAGRPATAGCPRSARTHQRRKVECLAVAVSVCLSAPPPSDVVHPSAFIRVTDRKTQTAGAHPSPSISICPTTATITASYQEPHLHPFCAAGARGRRGRIAVPLERRCAECESEREREGEALEEDGENVPSSLPSQTVLRVDEKRQTLRGRERTGWRR